MTTTPQKILSAKQLLEQGLDVVQVSYKIGTNGEVEEKRVLEVRDIFYSELIDSGKFTKNIAWELRVGKGLARTGQTERGTIYKINVVRFENGEFFTELGHSVTTELEPEEKARNWLSSRREWYLKQANKAAGIASGVKVKRGSYNKVKKNPCIG